MKRKKGLAASKKGKARTIRKGRDVSHRLLERRYVDIIFRLFEKFCLSQKKSPGIRGRGEIAGGEHGLKKKRSPEIHRIVFIDQLQKLRAQKKEHEGGRKEKERTSPEGKRSLDKKDALVIQSKREKEGAVKLRERRGNKLLYGAIRKGSEKKSSCRGFLDPLKGESAMQLT